jgi:hypothetical protein
VSSTLTVLGATFFFLNVVGLLLFPFAAHEDPPANDPFNDPDQDYCKECGFVLNDHQLCKWCDRELGVLD